MRKLACNKHGWCFWLYNFSTVLTEKICNSFIDTYNMVKNLAFYFAIPFFLTKKYLFSPFFLSLFIFLFQSFPLFFHLFIIFLLVAMLLLSLMNTLSVPFLTISSLTKEYLHISSRTHAYSIATPSYITLSLFLFPAFSL